MSHVWGCGGMVDATDLKSVVRNGRASSSLATPIFNNLIEFSVWSVENDTQRTRSCKDLSFDTDILRNRIDREDLFEYLGTY
jgi:hypothetical protein